MSQRSLRVFLCHSSSDKPSVRKLYNRLQGDRMAPWLDEKDLLPGQDWQHEISKAVRNSDVVVVCLSKDSVSKSGYVQKEINFALDVADEQPEGAIFLIPVKLEACEVPDRLRRWHWVNLFEEGGYQRLVQSLKVRAQHIGVIVEEDGKIIEITDENFDREVLRHEMPFLLEFWAEWCQPCKVLESTLVEIARSHKGIARVGKIDIDKYSYTPQQFQIKVIPTLVAFKNGTEQDRVSGLTSKEVITRMLGRLT